MKILATSPTLVAYSATSAYDPSGNLTQEIDDRGETIDYSYDVANNELTQTYNPSAGIDTYELLDANGNATLTVDARGLTTQNAYDGDNRLTLITDQYGNTTQEQYDGNGNHTRTIDARNLVTFYGYDIENRLFETVLPNSVVTKESYDKDSNVTNTVDANGKTTTYAYDLENRLTLTTDPLGNATSQSYDQNGDMTLQIDARGGSTTYQYDALGQITWTYDPNHATTQKKYDGDGNVTWENDALGKTEQFLYDGENRLTQTFDQDNFSTSKAYDQDGNVTLAFNADGRSTSYQYDSDNRLTWSKDPAGNTAQTAYDPDSNVTLSIDGRNNATTYVYDSDNRLTKVTDPLGDVTQNRYDADGNLTWTQDPRANTTQYQYNSDNRLTKTIDALSRSTQKVYDQDGNVTLSIDARGKTTTYAYDSDERLIKTINPDNSTTQEAYDKDGNVTLDTDPNGHTTTYQYDSDNRMTWSKDANGYTTQMAYDGEGNLLTETDDLGDKTTFAYDADNRKTMMIDPLGNSAVYAYDGNGWMTTLTDRDGRWQSLVYDADGRLLTDTWYPAGSTTAVDTLIYTYDADGKILTAANNLASYSFGYDADEQVTSVNEPFGASLSFAYDKDGDRTLVIDSFGGTQYSTYNTVDQLTNLQFSNVGNSVLQIAQQFNQDNQVTQQQRYGPGSPSTAVADATFTRDNAGLVTSLVYTNAATTATLASYSLAYDAANNLTTQIDHGNTTTYAYDNAGQLTGDSSESFSYDGNGNRSGYTYNASYKNELVSDGTWGYSYDGEGNEISKYSGSTTWTYGYNNANEMTSAVDTVSGTVAKAATYKYDVFGNRIETDVAQSGTTTTTRYAYDGWDPAKGTGTGNENYAVWAEMDGSSSLTTRYVDGDGVNQVFARLPYSSGSYTTYWYLTDPQGTIRDVIDSTATVVDTINYGAYGNITSESGSNTAARGPYGWDGYVTDAVTGLNYVHARYYDPNTGRWISQDPLGFDAGDSNLYRYVNNRPTVQTDPSGLQVGPNYGPNYNAQEQQAFGMNPSGMEASAQIPDALKQLYEQQEKENFDENQRRVEILAAGEKLQQSIKESEKLEQSIAIDQFMYKVQRAYFGVRNFIDNAEYSLAKAELQQTHELREQKYAKDLEGIAAWAEREKQQIRREAAMQLAILQKQMDAAEAEISAKQAKLRELQFRLEGLSAGPAPVMGPAISGLVEGTGNVLGVVREGLYVTTDIFVRELGSELSQHAYDLGLTNNIYVPEWRSALMKGAQRAQERGGDAALSAYADKAAKDFAVSSYSGGLVPLGVGIYRAFAYNEWDELGHIAAGVGVQNLGLAAALRTPNNPAANSGVAAEVENAAGRAGAAAAEAEGAAPRVSVPEPIAAPARTYRFQQNGITYSSEITRNANGSTTINHYVTQNGQRQLVGISEISAEGRLTNAFDVPEALRRQDISRRMYDEAAGVGYRSVQGTYNPGSDNFAQFYQHYNPATGNAAEAVLRTPAGIVNAENGLRPTNIRIAPNNGAISVDWVRGE